MDMEVTAMEDSDTISEAMAMEVMVIIMERDLPALDMVMAMDMVTVMDMVMVMVTAMDIITMARGQLTQRLLL